MIIIARSGMFWNVPGCSMFQILSTALVMLVCSRTSSFTAYITLTHDLLSSVSRQGIETHGPQNIACHTQNVLDKVCFYIYDHLQPSSRFVKRYVYLFSCENIEPLRWLRCSQAVQVDQNAFKIETHLTDRKALMSRFALAAIKKQSGFRQYKCSFENPE